MKACFSQHFKNKAGQSLTEYALILAVIAVVVIAVMTTMGGEVKKSFQSVICAFDSAATGCIK